MNEVDDLDLILRIMDRDEQAFLCLLRKHVPKATGALRARFKGIESSIIDDAVNRAALTLWESAERYDESRGTVGGFLYTCAYYEVLTLLRSGKKAAFVSLDTIQGLAAPPTGVPEEDEVLDTKQRKRREDLLSIIAGLPQLQRAICEADLCSGCDSDNDYLAEVHHTSKGSIYTSRSKAQEKIKLEMKKRGHYL